MKTNPIKQLRDKARDCGGCAKRREAIKRSWNNVIGRSKPTPPAPRRK